MYLSVNVHCFEIIIILKKKDLYFGEQVKRTSGVVASFTILCSFSFSAVIKYDFKRILQCIKPSEVQRGVLEDLDEEDER